MQHRAAPSWRTVASEKCCERHSELMTTPKYLDSSFIPHLLPQFSHMSSNQLHQALYLLCSCFAKQNAYDLRLHNMCIAYLSTTTSQHLLVGTQRGDICSYDMHEANGRVEADCPLGQQKWNRGYPAEPLYGRSTPIHKRATPYAEYLGFRSPSHDRSVHPPFRDFEVDTLHRIWPNFPSDMPITVPMVHHFDSIHHAIMMDNAGVHALPLNVALLAGCISPSCSMALRGHWANFCTCCPGAEG